MKLVSLQNMIDRALQAADMEYGGPRTETEVIGLVNRGVEQIHGLLVDLFGDEYYHLTQTAAFEAGTTDYLLPEAFYKGQGVDVQAGTGQSDYIPIRRYGEAARGVGTSLASSAYPRYRVRGGYLTFRPPPADTRNYRLHYSPAAPSLIKQTFIADSGADTLTLADHGLRRNDPVRLTSTGTLPAGLAASTTYWVIVTDTGTLQLAATRDGTAIDITDTGTAGATHTLVSLYDGVNGYDEYAVLYAGVVLLDKEESDSRSKAKLRDQIKADLEQMAANRDIGGAFPIHDVLYGGGHDPDRELDQWPTV